MQPTESKSLLRLSPKAAKLKEKLEIFVRERCIPAEREYDDHVAQFHGADRWKTKAIPPCMDRLKREARELGLWNIFLPHELPAFLSRESPGAYLSTREYGILCEVMGRSYLAPEACNCSAPDTGNMEVLLKHGTREQQEKYLPALLEGNMRSAFLMTEPQVASSDATNIEAKLTKVMEGGRVRYVLNGRKWWSSGAMHPCCGLAVVLAKMDYSHPSCAAEEVPGDRHGAQTVVLVPMKSPGVRCIRPLTVFGYDDAPHGHAEVALENVDVDASAVVLGEGRGFAIAQSRLGPGRIHHCMRAVGLAARCYELMLERSLTRETFGKLLCQHGGCQEIIADSVSDVESARLMTLSCAEAIDEFGPKGARDKIAMIKVVVPELTLRVADRAIQVFGGAGVSGDFPLARAVTYLRTLRIADGPDAVHKMSLARQEIKKARKTLALTAPSSL